MSQQQLTLLLDMDRVACITRELIRIQETENFTSVRLSITESEILVTPIADQTKIVLKRE